MAGEGGQMSTGAGGTPASQQQPSTLLSSPAGSAVLPGLMSSSGASGVSQTALTASQQQQQKNQQAQRASLYTQGAPIQVDRSTGVHNIMPLCRLIDLFIFFWFIICSWSSCDCYLGSHSWCWKGMV